MSSSLLLLLMLFVRTRAKETDFNCVNGDMNMNFYTVQVRIIEPYLPTHVIYTFFFFLSFFVECRVEDNAVCCYSVIVPRNFCRQNFEADLLMLLIGNKTDEWVVNGYSRVTYEYLYFVMLLWLYGGCMVVVVVFVLVWFVL